MISFKNILGSYILLFLSGVIFAGNARIIERETNKLLKFNQQLLKKVSQKEDLSKFENEVIYINAEVKTTNDDNLIIEVYSISTDGDIYKSKKGKSRKYKSHSLIKARVGHDNLKGTTLKIEEDCELPEILKSNFSKKKNTRVIIKNQRATEVP